MRKQIFALLAAVSITGLTPTVFAEGPVLAQPTQSQPAQGQGPVMAPEGQPVYYEEAPPPGTMEAAPPPPTAQQGRGIEYGAHLLVPIFATNPVAVLDNGVDTGSANAGFGLGLQARAGWEFGYGFSAEINIGGTFNTMNGEIGGVDIDPDTSLYMLWIGAGARYSFLNPSAIVPFVGAGGGILFQSFCANDAPSCDLEPAGMVNALAGVIYEISPHIGLEAGLQANVVFANGDVFADTELFLSPFVGATLYY